MQRLRRAALLWAATALCFAAMMHSSRAAAGRAGWTPRVEWRVSNPGANLPPGEVLVNSRIVLRLRSELGGFLPEQRAQVAADRLRAAVASGLTRRDVTVDVTTDKDNPRLKALGQTIAVASSDDARGTGATPAGLARSWSDALQDALQVPGLILVGAEKDKRIVVPLGENRTLKIGGAARGAVSVSVGSGAGTVLRASSDPDMENANVAEVMLSGVGPGRETLTLVREGAETTIAVAVQPYAGRIEARPQLIVTGREVSGERVARYASLAALNSAQPVEGATVRLVVAPDKIGSPAVAAGQLRTVEVPLLLEGQDMIAVGGVAKVGVVNRTLPPIETSDLMYSNDPERLLRFGTLFAARLNLRAGANRLLYHHQSALERACVFCVELVNDADTAASVQVVGGAAGPVRDTVWVGYRAAALFVRDQRDDVGAILELPARSRIAVTAQRLSPGLTISGIVQLRQLTGAKPLLVRVGADLPEDPRTAPGELLLTTNPWTSSDAAGIGDPFPLSPHVYPGPRKVIAARYDVGGRWAFVSIGRVPLQAAGGGAQRLDGNYGVFYEIEFTLSNPTTKPANARLIFEPSAGLAGGVFLVDNQSVEIPQIRPPTESVLGRYPLAPGETRIVRVKTLPLSGSNYPIRLAVQP